MALSNFVVIANFIAIPAQPIEKSQTALVYLQDAKSRQIVTADVMPKQMSRRSVCHVIILYNRSTEVIFMHDIISDVAGMLHDINLTWGASRM